MIQNFLAKSDQSENLEAFDSRKTRNRHKKLFFVNPGNIKNEKIGITTALFTIRLRRNRKNYMQRKIRRFMIKQRNFIKQWKLIEENKHWLKIWFEKLLEIIKQKVS